MDGAEQRNRLLEAMDDAVFINTDDRIAYCNPALLRLLGASRAEDLLGRPPISIFHPRHHDTIRRRIETIQTLRVAVPIIEEEVVHLVDGTIPVEVVATNLHHDDRPSILVVLRDLRRRKDLEAQFQLLVGAVADYAIFTLDAAGYITTWNDGAMLLHGYTMAEAIGQPHSILYCADDAAAGVPQRDLASAIAGGPAVDGWSARKDGSRFLCNSVTTALRDSDGRPRGFVKIVRDMSERRASAAALNDSEDRNRNLFDCVADPLFVYDRESLAYLAVNDAAIAHYGYSREEFLGMTIKDIRPAEDVPALLDMLARAGAGQEARGVWRHQKKDGAIVHMEISARGLNMGGRPACLVHARDVTARLKAEREAQEAFDRIAEQAALLDHARDAIVVRDLDLRATYWNRSAERLYGFHGDDAATRSSPESLYVDASKVEEARRTTLERGDWSGELRVNGSGGRALLVASQWSLVRDKANRPRAVLIISTDITEKKSLEAQFIRAQRMESIGTLAGGIAHDLNNVLAPILMSIDFLRGEMVNNPEALDTLDTIDVCARRGADLVKQVLTYARGAGDGERTTVDIAHLARELLRVLEDTLPRSIALRFNPSHELWTVSGDATQLHQVLLNLCINARDAMPDGGTLDLSIQNIVLDETYASMNVDARPGPYVMVQVKDTGTGIPREIMERIFDPFFTTKEVGKGTGLGLSTTQTIVKGHGGFINVYSEPGKGTKFKVYLPSNISSAAAANVVSKQTGLPRGDGEIVLVVDDEEAIRKVVRSTLERFGYEVMLASHGAEAVALYAQHRQRIALVLTDMAMPVMDGPTTIIAIRAINADARIVGSSGLTANGDVAKAIGAGVKHFVAKPYTAEALLSTLARALGKLPDA